MRELKFRVWHEGLGKFIYFDNLSFSYEDSYLLSSANPNEAPEDWSEAPIHQFTGAKDKNGKEIYEGDIVNLEEHSLYHSRVDIHKTVIQYDSTCSAFVAMEDGHGHSLCGQEIALEVVGNIYEKH